jgi:hypothetical protein
MTEQNAPQEPVNGPGGARGAETAPEAAPDTLSDAHGATEDAANPADAETAPDFFQPGHTYRSAHTPYTAPELITTFEVEHVTRHPDRGHLRAIGWSRTGEPGAGWHGDFYDQGEFNGWADVTKPAATDTLPEWLYQRFAVIHGAPTWDQATDSDRAYWEHQARAVRRAVARGGFKAEVVEETHVVADDSDDPEHVDDCPGCVGSRPCGHDDYHDPHEWADRPGVWCPGHSHADDEAATA